MSDEFEGLEKALKEIADSRPPLKAPDKDCYLTGTGSAGTPMGRLHARRHQKQRAST
jgi:hypothetical protein